MKSRRSMVAPRSRRAGSKCLSLALVALVSVLPVATATPGGGEKFLTSPMLPSVRFAVRDSLQLAPSSVASVTTVNTTGDGGNINAGVGCDTDAATPGEQCSLRAAIQRTNALAGDDTIAFDIPLTEPNCDAGTGFCTIKLGGVLPDLSTNVAMGGPGVDKLLVRRDSGGGFFRIFRVTSAGTVSLSGLRFENGNAGSGDGGGIENAAGGTLNVTACLLFSNFAVNGGGIANSSTGTLNVTNSLLFGNGFTGNGGGIYNNSTGTVSVTNSVFTQNGVVSVTGANGGALFNQSGAMNVSNCTITENSAQLVGGVVGPATVKSTIIAANLSSTSSRDVFGSFTSAGFNLIGVADGSTGFTAATDQKGTFSSPLNPQLEPTNIFGSIIQRGEPVCGSPAVDKGTSAALTGSLTTDVRGTGFPRTLDDTLVANAAGGDGTDIGAFERPICSHVQFTFNVNTTGDADDANPGDTACDSDASVAGAQCSLRAAISESIALASDQSQTINFAIPTTDPGFNSSTGSHTIMLTGALPTINVNLNISGPGADKLTVRRNTGGLYSVFNITLGTPTASSVTISGLTISNGLAQTDGGGIRHNGGTLTVTDCVIADNFAQNRGGGIFSNFNGILNVTNCMFRENFTLIFSSSSDDGGGGISGGRMNITNCTFAGNDGFNGGAVHMFLTPFFPGGARITGSTFTDNSSASGKGGGLDYFAQGSEALSIVNSTFSDNSASEGGGIYSHSGSLNISNSTLSRNNASPGGGIKVEAGTVQVKSTIIAANTSGGNPGPDVFGAFTSGGFNLVGKSDGSTGFSNGVNNDQVGAAAAPLDPKLDPTGLQNNGGPTQTIALLAGSPAIDQGTANSLVGALTTDQRDTGFARTFDDPAVTNAADGTDIGAFERNPAAPTPTPTPTPTSTPTPTPTPTSPTFQFDAAVYTVQEGCTAVNVRVLRSGSLGAVAAVDIVSDDGTAKQKGDYTLVVGHLIFAAGEAEKTFQVLINEDSYTEGLEFATLLLQHPTNGTLGTLSTATLEISDNASEISSNPIDDSGTFVCTHYHDFLYRQADQSGQDFWIQQIEQCGANTTCRQSKRVDVSTAFFLSTEFQQTGYFVIRAHKAAFGNLKSNPRYEVFLRDQRVIGEGVVVGQPGFQQQLDANRQKYLEDFVTRPEFVALFPQGATAVAYVELLFANAGATPTQTERDAAIAAYGSGNTAGRAAALRSVVESGSVFNAQFNSAFVLMQYYGYLRRNPDDAPDNNFNGYDFWLAKMNSFTVPGEDARNESVALARVRRAEMVKAFIESAEYRQRFFGAVGGNQQGSLQAKMGAIWGEPLARSSPFIFDRLFAASTMARSQLGS